VAVCGFRWDFGHYICLIRIWRIWRGDAKIFPALGLFVAYSDWIDFMIVLVAAMIAAVLLVIILRLTPLQKYTPEWKTWNAGRFIPMGLALGSSIIFYYVLALNTL